MLPNPLRLDPRLPEPLRAFVERDLAGLRRAEPVTFTQLSPLSEAASGTTVVFHQSQVSAHWAPFFARAEPLLLCALRADGLPSAAEWALLRSLLFEAPLRPPGVPFVPARVDSVAALQHAAEEVARQVGQDAPGAPAAKLASDVAHELLANALLDAPVDDQGRPRYANRRDEAPRIAQEDGCDFAVGVQGGRIYLSVTDRFGRLSPAPLARMLQRYGQKVQTDTSGGGAGLGLRQILEACEAIAFRIQPGQHTEVVAVIDVTGPRRRATQMKSLFFRTMPHDVPGGQP